VVILLFAARLLLLQARRLRKAKLPRHRAWRILGLGFCFLSLDEVVGLHETLNTVTDFSWTLPGAAVAAIVEFIYIPFLIISRHAHASFLFSAVPFMWVLRSVSRAPRTGTTMRIY
jgi:hypothetical protein